MTASNECSQGVGSLSGSGGGDGVGDGSGGGDGIGDGQKFPSHSTNVNGSIAVNVEACGGLRCHAIRDHRGWETKEKR